MTYAKPLNPTAQYALQKVRAQRNLLTTQQYRTIRGQILAGYPEAALQGLARLLQRKHR